MINGATLSLEADPGGGPTTGVFDLTGNIDISPGIRTRNPIGSTGTRVSALSDATATDANRADYLFDAGAGALVVKVDFRGWEGRADPWGDGSDDPRADASGEDVWRQMSVLTRYLDRGTFDSRGGATLEWGEFSTDGVYEPVPVAPEQPRTSFTATDGTAVFDGSLTLVAARSIDRATLSQRQDTR